MALGFGTEFFGGQRGMSFISGPQFEQDPTTLKLIGHTFGGTGTETIYTVPAGKTLYVTKVMLVNVDPTTGRLFHVIFDGITIFRAFVITNDTREIDFPSPIPMTAELLITGITGDIGSIIALIGWEV